jgi:hypothetical protein
VNTNLIIPLDEVESNARVIANAIITILSSLSNEQDNARLTMMRFKKEYIVASVQLWKGVFLIRIFKQGKLLVEAETKDQAVLKSHLNGIKKLISFQD